MLCRNRAHALRRAIAFDYACIIGFKVTRTRRYECERLGRDSLRVELAIPPVVDPRNTEIREWESLPALNLNYNAIMAIYPVRLEIDRLLVS